MIEASDIVIIVGLVVGIAIATWWFVVAYKYGKTVDQFSYARGANLDTGNTGKGNIVLQCDNNTEICVNKATAICTGAINQLSNTEGGPEPIANGLNNTGMYGDFNKNNTVDLTGQLSKLANGKNIYEYCFDATGMTFGGGACPFSSFDKKTGVGQRPQLIATYTCMPKGTPCKISSALQKKLVTRRVWS